MAESVAEKIKDIADFIAWVKTLGDGEFIFRGQANADWPLRSGATRRVCGSKPKDVIDYEWVVEYIDELVSRLKQKELHAAYKHLDSDIKILAELQHHGAATPLLDFSRNSLIALWMACSDEFKKPGRIFALNLRETHKSRINRLSVDNISPVKELLKNDQTSWIWDPSHFNKRIPAQYSVFLLAREPYDESLKCENIIIPIAAKRIILKQLKDLFGIEEFTIYPDFEGFARLNAADKDYREDFKAFVAGNVKYLDDDFDGAIAEYNKAIKHNPDYALAYYYRGSAKLAKGLLDDAIADFNRAIELDSKYANAYIYRAIAFKLLEQYDKARADWLKCRELATQSNNQDLLTDVEEFLRELDELEKTVEKQQ